MFNFRKMILLCYIVLTVVGCLVFGLARSAAGVPKRFLLFDDVHHAQISVINHITAIYRDENTVLTLTNSVDYYVVSDYNPNPKEPYLAFSNDYSGIAQSKRVFFNKKVGFGMWQGVAPFVKNSLLFIDGAAMKIVALEQETSAFISARDIIADLIKPPKDSRGEPIAKEISYFRRRFKNAFLRLRKNISSGHRSVNIDGYKYGRNTPLIVSGMVTLPIKWRENERAQFLLATQIKGFPIVKMHCSNDTLTTCIIKRGCFIHNATSLKNDSIYGIAVSPKRKLLLIGESKNQIGIFKYRSCYHVTKVGTLVLPEQFFELQSIHIDKFDNLWVGTMRPDNYKNASLYVFLSKDW